MGETKTLISARPISYTGLLDISELYKVIDRWCKENNYDKVENKNFEDVFENSRQIIMELVPYKVISDYAKVEIRIFMVFKDLVEEVVKRSGVKKKLMKGNAFFSIDCYAITDYEAHWETKPAYFFLRTLIEKFVYKGYAKNFEGQAIAEAEDIIKQIKSYLNMQQFK